MSYEQQITPNKPSIKYKVNYAIGVAAVTVPIGLGAWLGSYREEQSDTIRCDKQQRVETVIMQGETTSEAITRLAEAGEVHIKHEGSVIAETALDNVAMIGPTGVSVILEQRELRAYYPGSTINTPQCFEAKLAKD